VKTETNKKKGTKNERRRRRKEVILMLHFISVLFVPCREVRSVARVSAPSCGYSFP
jgi:hypothetical protein